MQKEQDSSETLKHFGSHAILYEAVNVLALSQVYLFELGLGRLKKTSLVSLFKRWSLDNFAKAFSLSFKAIDRMPKDVEYVFLNDVYNQSMVQNMNGVKHEFEHSFIELITDKRLLAENSFPYYSFHGFFFFLMNLPKFFATLFLNYNTIRAVGRLFDVPTYLVAFNLIDSLFVLMCAKVALQKLERLKCIVLNTDVHKTSRALVLLAKQRNIRTGVLQHGSPVLEYGYLPVLSDYFFTWGEISQKWFNDRGTPLKKLLLTGTPKADKIFTHPLFSKRNNTNKIEKVLLIINPVGVELVIKMLQICKDAAIDKTYELTIKLHPSSNDNREEVEKIFPKNVQVLKHENTHTLLAETDAVITTNSTVGNEAIAFNKPLVQLKLRETEDAMDYEDYNCSLLVADAIALKKTLGDITVLYSKIPNYKNYVENYFYKLDGMAAQRIIEIVTGEV